METIKEVTPNYGLAYVICPKCKLMAGYRKFFDFNRPQSFKCGCGKTLSEIKKAPYVSK